MPNFKGEAGLWGQITYLSKNYRQLPNQKSIWHSVPLPEPLSLFFGFQLMD